ncbi:hypothetical protein [Haloarchaeobius sp. HRN-SO-5]|uniref:hypothetical protein n=1 Tax=Haloarchaeobius sp. HRN-SO-5 TaxID=3446118 RepID=UPI003EBA05E3
MASTGPDETESTDDEGTDADRPAGGSGPGSADADPETVAPDAVTCRLHTAVGEADALTLTVRPTDDGGTEVTRIVHVGDEELETATTLDRPVTLACARVLVSDLPGPAADVRLVRPVLRGCDAADAVASEATFTRDGDRFVREGRRGRPTPPTSPPTYRLERLRGGGLVAGGLVPAVGRLRKGLFGLRERFGEGSVDVTDDELVVTLDRPTGAQTVEECWVENGALCVWLLGETERDGDVERDERSCRVVPPFPVTADGATATRDGSAVVVRVPRCPRAAYADGDVPVDD